MKNNGHVYNNLHLVTLKDDEMKERHQGYTYLVRDGSLAHTAYRTQEGLNRFLQQTGLRIGKSDGYWDGINEIEGEYVSAMMGDEVEFQSMIDSGQYEQTEWMSNGEVTLALIEKGSNGNTIYYLGPNCDRVVYPFDTHRNLYLK